MAASYFLLRVEYKTDVLGWITDRMSKKLTIFVKSKYAHKI